MHWQAQTNTKFTQEIYLETIRVAVLFSMTMAAGASAQTKTPPPQYTKPTGEPVPQSSTLAEAPEAPPVPANWAKQLADKNEALSATTCVSTCFACGLATI